MGEESQPNQNPGAAEYRASAQVSSSSDPAKDRPIVVVQQPSMFRNLVGWLGWLVAGLCLMAVMGLYTSKMEYFDTTAGIQEKYHSLSRKHSENKIAIIDASGVIMSGEGFVKQQIDQVRSDDSVKGIVLRVNSPGGTVYGSDFMYHHLVKLREERELPMVVSMGSLATSGGYYVSMAVGDQERCIFAEPMTTTGSIGVIIPHYDFSGLMKRYDVVDDSIATHPRKNMLSSTKPMTDDDREVIGKYIDHAFRRFKEVVKHGRPQFEADSEALDKLATGEVFTAKQAKESGLIDEIGFIDDAIERVLEMADLDKATTRVVKYKRPVTLIDAISLGKSPQKNVLAEILSLNVHQAYYLANPLPSLLAPVSP